MTSYRLALPEPIHMQAQCSVDLSFLCCPYADHGRLSPSAENEIVCESCKRRFRSVGGRPILIDEGKSIFRADDVEVLADKRQFPENSGWRYQLRRLLPAAASRDISLELLAKSRHQLAERPVVLIIGCGSTGGRFVEFFSSGRVFPTDVTLQGDAALVCDGECLPFRDQTVDCVVADQVLEHALNPYAVVSEINRCLKPGGIVYSGVPFHTPVHAYPFDFSRYTPLGHRMLFREFEEIEFCITQGPVSALSKTLIGFIGSLSANVWWRRFGSMAIRLLFSSLLWIDRRYTSVRDLGIPAASAFLGRKRAGEETPIDLVQRWSQLRESCRN